MKKFSIIIPSYNEEGRIGDLLKSIENLDYPKNKFEVIVVNDGSTDRTKNVVLQFPFVKLVDLKENRGRFIARKIGSEKAKYENLFFIDSRSVVDRDALNVLNSNNKYRVMIGHSLGIDNPNAFETFYTAIRKKIFPNLSSTLVELNSENFDRYPKGTTVLFVEREVWNKALAQFTRTDTNVSDDTKILYNISKDETIAINPKLKITNFVRSSFSKSINHLFNRGIKFVDYYLNPRKRNFWIVIVLPPILFIGVISFLILSSLELSTKILIIFSLYLFLTLFLSYNLRSFLKILYIMPLIVLTFYAGIIKGIFLKIINNGNE